LFIPIGGSRGTKWKVNWNLFVTMALGGLWHGAAWNFVVWGIYHGLCLIIHREFVGVKAKLPQLQKFWDSKVFHALSMLLTFNAVVVGCVFFGMTNISAAFNFVKRMVLMHPIFTSVEGHHFLVLKQEMPLVVPVVIAMTLTLLVLNYPLGKLIEKRAFNVVPVPVKAVYWSALVVLMITFMSNAAQPFIYFQF